MLASSSSSTTTSLTSLHPVLTNYNASPTPYLNPSFLSFSSNSSYSYLSPLYFGLHGKTHVRINPKPKVMISGAPASGKGTQCELIVQKDLKAMTDAAGNWAVILINPRLKDLPGSSGIKQTMGRDKRLEYAASFESCYFFRLLYYDGTQYPIMGAIRMTYPYGYELYKRVDESSRKEKYVSLSTFIEKPTIDEINDAFLGKPRNKDKKASGIWGFLSGVFWVQLKLFNHKADTHRKQVCILVSIIAKKQKLYSLDHLPIVSYQIVQFFSF